MALFVLISTRNAPTIGLDMILAILMVLGAGIFRLVGNEFHWWNIAPVAAMALLGGMYLGRRYALWVPLAVLAMTDIILNVRMGYPMIYWPRAFDYGAFLLVGLLGLWARERKLGTKINAAIVTPFLFFFISNFAVWLFGTSLANAPYAKTFSGLAECYAAGLPFLRGTVIGDWGFMAVFALSAVVLHRTSGERPHRLVAEARA
jgi:hypothetical protein